PALQAFADRCVERVLEVELARVERPTAATKAARDIRCLRGTALLFRFLVKLGERPYKTGRDDLSRAGVLTHLISVTLPAAEDTPVAFHAQAESLLREHKISEERLIELPFLAPQWAALVEQFLGWPGLEEGVWWLLAHALQRNDGQLQQM